eukprot:GEMP01021110.1.p1 GENE.GEMP01021110.1~~GEMP01021110.1.p1  ORF type:complete len:432 (-),score=116.98 GEMP01021110.1:1111-2406(-)
MSLPNPHPHASTAFDVPPPSAPPQNPLWGTVSAPEQHSMNDPFDHFEWRGREMLSVKQDNVEVLYFRRHSPATTLNPCLRKYDFFRTVDSSISYQVKGWWCFQTYRLAVDDKEVAKLENAKWCENGWAYALGLSALAPPIATLGTITVNGQPRFRMLRKVEKSPPGPCCEFRTPCSCKPPPEYALVNQPIFDAVNSRGSTMSLTSNVQVHELRMAVEKIKGDILDLEVNGDTTQRKSLKSLQAEEKKLTDQLKTIWQQLFLLKPVARSESLLRRVGCLCCVYWEPVRVMVTPEEPGFTSDEIRAAGLLSIAHLTRGVNGPLLRTKDENLGAARHKFTFEDMLKHQAEHEVGKDATSKYASAHQTIESAPSESSPSARRTLSDNGCVRSAPSTSPASGKHPASSEADATFRTIQLSDQHGFASCHSPGWSYV